GQGAAGDLRRPGAAPARPRSRRRGTHRGGSLGLMPTIQIVSIAGCALLLLIVLELVRQRRFLERYALLWLFSALVLLGLAVWRDALEVIANALGIIYPPNALFLIAGGFVLVLLLH